MRTFRSEVFNGREVIRSTDSARTLHDIIDSVLDRYGSYRVVEGELYVASVRPRGVVGVRPSRRGGGTVIGRVGDHVKLLLPPEEKGAALSEHEQRMFERMREAEGDAHYARGEAANARHRADKYEKALRELALGAGYAGRIAREALDE